MHALQKKLKPILTPRQKKFKTGDPKKPNLLKMLRNHEKNQSVLENALEKAIIFEAAKTLINMLKSSNKQPKQ